MKNRQNDLHNEAGDLNLPMNIQSIMVIYFGTICAP
jgi:hypothetical protein